MLPPVIHEKECHLFKFWFHGSVREGMVYRRELFYRLQSVPGVYRANLYQEACSLAIRDAVVVTVTSGQCSLWVSLRSKNCVRLLQKGYSLVGEKPMLKGPSHPISS